MRTIRLLFAAVVLAALAFAPQGAQARHRMRRPVAQPAVTVSLVDAQGFALDSVMHRSKRFVAGERGARYGIRVDNNTAARVEVVVSVDGRDVISRALADFRRQRGYVIPARGSIVIDGFRNDMAHVSAFRFSDVRHSMAGRRGTPKNVGVIGVAVFRERMMRMDSHRAPMAEDRAAPAGRSRNKRSADRAGSMRSGRDLGTAAGERRMSSVRLTSFTRRSMSRPDLTTALFYDSRQGLVARGVPIRDQPVFVANPGDNPWPGATAGRSTRSRR